MVGERIGDFDVTGRLGGTTLASVYLARDPAGREVALKVLRPYYADEPGILDTYDREVGALRGLHHPNVVSLLWAGRAGKAYGMASEYVPWPTLQKWLDETEIAPPLALYILRQVAAALDYAHSQGVVHGNLKPSNIFCNPETGAVKVGDFGMALVTSQANVIVRESINTPSPMFAAPEQLHDRPAGTGSDMYALAALAYRLLTGEPPYYGLNVPTVRTRQEAGDPPLPSSLNPKLSADVDGLFIQALSQAPDTRPANGDELVRRLEEALGDLARSPLPLPVSLGAVATAAAAAKAATTPTAVAPEGWRVVCPRCAGLNEPGTPGCTVCWRNLRGIDAVSPDELDRRAAAVLWRRKRIRRLRRSAYVLVVLVLVLVTSYNILGLTVRVPKASSTLTSAPQPLESTMLGRDPTRSNFTPGPVAALKGNVRWQLKTDWFLWSTPAVAGDTLYLATGDRRILAVDAKTGAVRWEHKELDPLDSSPAIAGDTLVVGLRGGGVVALNKVSGAERWRFTEAGPVLSSPVISEGAVIFGSADNSVYAVDAVSGKLLWSFPTADFIESSPAVYGDIVAIGSNDDHLYLLDRTTGKVRLIFNIGSDVNGNPAISDERVFVAGFAGVMPAVDIHQKEVPFDRAYRSIWMQLYVWDVVGPPPLPRGFLWTFRDKDLRPTSGPSVGGDRVFIAGDSGAVYAVNKASGATLWKFSAQDAVRQSPAIVGNTVYVGDLKGNVFGIDAATGKQVFHFMTGDRVIASPVYADGLLYVASGNGILYAIE